MIGDIPMPAGFRYREILLKGKPKHDKTDAFRIGPGMTGLTPSASAIPAWMSGNGQRSLPRLMR